MNKENDFPIDREKVDREDKISNKIINDSGVEELFKKAIKGGCLAEGKRNSNWIYRKYNRYLDDKEPLYISLGFNMDDSREHWSEVKISVIEEKLYVLKYETKNNKYIHCLIEECRLEESVLEAIIHPINRTKS
jgi:hypothetical protein